MRRILIHYVLPSVFTAVPVLAALLIFAAIPPDARRDYMARVKESPIDWVIISVGTTLFVAQIILSWQAMRLSDNKHGFNTKPDAWLKHLNLAAEWFPLLGLIGTVAAILQTFSSITPDSDPTPQMIIRKYAPAITATGGGLYMALVNILPGWVVNAGRMLIRSLDGTDPPAPPENEVPLVNAETDNDDYQLVHPKPGGRR